MKKIGKVSIKNYELLNKYKFIKICGLIDKRQLVKIYELIKNCDLKNVLFLTSFKKEKTRE